MREREGGNGGKGARGECKKPRKGMKFPAKSSGDIDEGVKKQGSRTHRSAQKRRPICDVRGIDTEHDDGSDDLEQVEKEVECRYVVAPMGLGARVGLLLRHFGGEGGRVSNF